jgi:hypothetical protein
VVAALYDVNNVVVGHAFGFITPGVAGAVEPLIDDDEALFDPALWVSPWVAIGATHEGFKINVDTSTTTVNIEEQSLPVAETIESKGLNVEAALAEDTLETMQLSWGGGDITVTAAGVGQPGKRVMNLSDDVQYYTLALETRNKYGFARRIYIPKVSASGSGDINFRRAADKRTYPIRFASICRPEDIEVVEFTAAPTA